MQQKGVEVVYPKDVIKKAYAGKLIDNEERLAMLYDRNISSHTYNQDLADEIYARIKTYVPLLITQMQNLKECSL